MTTVNLYDMGSERMIDYALPEQEVNTFLQYLFSNSQWKHDPELIAEKALRFRKRAMEAMQPVDPPALPLERDVLEEASYPTLQEWAKERGLRSVGVSHEDLIESLVGK